MLYELPTFSLLQISAASTAVALLTVALCFMDLAAESWANPIDLKFGKIVIRHRNRQGTRWMHWASWLGGPYGITLSVLLFTLLLILQGFIPLSIIFFAVIGLSAAYVMLMKLLTGRPRPKRKPLEAERTYSFPSAHSLVSTAAYLAMGLITYRAVGMQFGSLIFISVALLLVAIGISRIYLGCHYLSDVVAGIFGGVVWAGIFYWLS